MVMVEHTEDKDMLKVNHFSKKLFAKNSSYKTRLNWFLPSHRYKQKNIFAFVI